MKALKIIGIILLSIFFILLIAGIIIPKKITFERSTTVNSPVNKVFENVIYFKNSGKWSPWKDYDPNMKTFIEGIDGTVGAKSIWEGNKKVGKGYQKIVTIDSNKYIGLDLVFIEPWQSGSKVYYRFEDNNPTTVFWGYEERVPIPKNIIMAIFCVKKALAKDFDKGLAELKKFTESE